MKRYNQASLFLMEMIIAILFFALASAVCVQVFVKSQTMSDDSLRKAHAAMAASNIAEVYRSQELEKYYKVDKDGYVYFDDQWKLNSSQSVYKALLVEKDSTLSVTILYNDIQLYNIDCMSYQQRTLEDVTP